MTSEAYEAYLNADYLTRHQIICDPANRKYFEQRLGTDAFSQLLAIAQKRIKSTAAKHLAASDHENLIFVPGIMGSLLKAKVGAGVWWIDALRSRDKIDLLGLASDGNEVEDEKRHVTPFALDNSYEGFAFAAYDEVGFKPVHYPYDWRKSILQSTNELATKIKSTWESNGNRPVHLVAHSMGGLVVRATLMQHYDQIKKYLGRIAFIATPHYGSPTIAYYFREHIRGTWSMWVMGNHLKRSTFRTLWGVMDLLPAPTGVYPGTRLDESHPCVNFNCFAADEWRLDLNSVEQSNFQNALSHSRNFHNQLRQSHLKLDSAIRNKMAMIVGVGNEMPFRVEIVPGHLYGHRTEVTLDRVPGDVNRDSDGSVPVASACLEGIGQTRFIVGEHAALPNIPAVYQDVFRFLRGDPMKLSTTPQGALAGHLSGGDGTNSVISHLNQSTDASKEFSTVNRWRIEAPTATELQRLETDLAEGRLPQFERVKLL